MDRKRKEDKFLLPEGSSDLDLTNQLFAHCISTNSKLLLDDAEKP